MIAEGEFEKNPDFNPSIKCFGEEKCFDAGDKEGRSGVAWEGKQGPKREGGS